jgi:GNAT superfamily N-acetyltransferase
MGMHDHHQRLRGVIKAMLDKSIEYKNVIMRFDRNKFETIAEPELPEGFSFRFFTPSDVKHWGRIEASVLEFDSEHLAESYFEIAYLPHIHELQKRCIFVLNPDEMPIATANAWYSDSELGHQTSLHWVAVCPEYQGKGIGKAIVKKALNVLHFLEPEEPVWLHTQTWSHAAIRLYHDLGFNMVRSERLGNMNTRSGKIEIYENDFAEALQVLKAVMEDEYIDKLLNTAV